MVECELGWKKQAKICISFSAGVPVKSHNKRACFTVALFSLMSCLPPKRFTFYAHSYPCEVGPCHHGMARPQVADGGTASDMEGSCE